MKRRTVLFVIAGFGTLVLAVLAVLAVLVVRSGSDEPYRTDADPIEDAFPELGPLSDARWVVTPDDDGRSIPAPDHVTSGFVLLQPERLADIVAAHTFTPADPFWLEETLKDQAPDNPRWLHSEEFDQAAADHTTFYFDQATNTVFFRETDF